MATSSQQAHLVPEAPLATRLVERLADFVKSFAIYPENNQRVQANLEALVETVQAGLDDEDCAPKGTITMSIHADSVRVGKVEVESREGTNVQWLRSRLERSLLSGIKISRPCTAESFVEFTRQLLEQYTRGQIDEEFEQLWPDEFVGVELLHRLFEGVFSAVEAGPGAPGGFGAPTADGLCLDLANQGQLAEALAGREEVRTRLERLQSLASEHRKAAGDAGDTRGMDVLGRISRLLPADALQDPARVLQIVTGALDEIAVKLNGGVGHEPGIADSELNRALFVASHRLFARDGIAPSASAANLRAGPSPERKGVGGHAGDGEILEDIQAFRDDISKLPALDSREVARRMILPIEQLGVVLHFLVEWENSRAQKLYPRVAALLTQPGPSEIELIKQYIERPDGEVSDEALAAWRHRHGRVSQCLMANGIAWIARQTGLLEPEEIVQRFPDSFTLFLHSLQTGNAQSASDLSYVCQRIGTARLDQVTPDLADRDALMLWDLPQRILSWPIVDTLPLARTILLRGGNALQPTVVSYLRSLGLDLPEACLLRIFRDPMEIPSRYLLGLMQLLTTGAWRKTADLAVAPSSQLTLMIAKELCRYLEEAGDDPDSQRRSAYAVKYLARFQTDEAREKLRELSGSRLFGFLSQRNASLRSAAREALKSY